MTSPTVTHLDTLGFADAVATLPEQLEGALARALDADLSSVTGRHVTSVAVLGLGGSGFSGDVAVAAAAPSMRVPVVVSKGYEAPAFVDEGTLVVAVSYSGATEETLEAAAASLRAGAPLVAVCSGGELARLAADAGAPVLRCVEGLQPRAAVGELVAPVLVTLERAGLLPEATTMIRQAVTQLAARRDTCRVGADPARNPARELARRIGRTIPLVYGGGALGAAAAMRWKTEINENAKAPAFWNAYPELDHNEICGWGQHGDVTRQVFTLVELRHAFEHAQVARRFEITRDIIEETLSQVLSVEAQGEGRLAQLLDLVYVGAWTSVYLAADAGVDPGPVEVISRLKMELSKGVHS